jgi:hypothetical protein
MVRYVIISITLILNAGKVGSDDRAGNENHDWKVLGSLAFTEGHLPLHIAFSSVCLCTQWEADHKVHIPIANSSTPDSRRFLDGGIISSWDFPSVIKMPILETPVLEPASGLKLFSKM